MKNQDTNKCEFSIGLAGKLPVLETIFLNVEFRNTRPSPVLKTKFVYKTGHFFPRTGQTNATLRRKTRRMLRDTYAIKVDANGNVHG